MKIYNLKDVPKWNNKIKISKPIIAFILINIILFPFLFYVLSLKTELYRSIITTLVVSSLISVDIIVTQILNYEKKTIVIDKNKINLLIVQRETSFYGTDVKRKIDIDYSDKKEIEKVINHLEDYIGLSLYTVDDYKVIKEKKDSIQVLFNGSISEWKYKEEKKIPKYVLVNKNKRIKMIIDNKYDNYKELIEFFNKK